MNTKTLFTLLLLLLGIQAIHAENPLASAPATHCLACDVPNGLQVVSVSGDSATLSWNAVAGAGQYTLEVEDEQNVPSTFHLEVNVTGTSFIVTVLAASGSTNSIQLPSNDFRNGCYLVQVRAGKQTQLLKWVVAK